MRHRGLFLALAVLALAAGAVTPLAKATGRYAVDIQECERNGGQATVPAGVPISVQNFAFVTGTYGLMRDFLLKQETSKGEVRDGTLTIVDVTDEWSAPEPLDSNPARGWITHLPDTGLDALAPGEVVQVGSLIRFTGPVQIVFTPVGRIGFGPFHNAAGDTLLNACELTAA